MQILLRHTRLPEPCRPQQSTGEKKYQGAKTVHSGGKASRPYRSNNGHQRNRGSTGGEGLQHGGIRRLGPASARFCGGDKARDAYSTARYVQVRLKNATTLMISSKHAEYVGDPTLEACRRSASSQNHQPLLHFYEAGLQN